MTLAQINSVPVPPNWMKFKFLGNGGKNSKSLTFYNPDLIGELVSRLLLFAIVAAGLFFFVRLLVAGFGFLTSQGDSAKIQSASKNITNAALGLVLVFSAFFIAQMLEVLFGINIL